MMQAIWQQILVYIVLAGALVYLVRRFLWRGKRKSGKHLRDGCGQDDCGCH